MQARLGPGSLGLALSVIALVGAAATAPSPVQGTPRNVRRPAPSRALATCKDCHPEQVASYSEHGMARTLGPAVGVTPGQLVDPSNGTRYELRLEAGQPWLVATARDGGRRRQRVVGRIGAGLLDISWITAEAAPGTDADTGRLFFAPLETVTGRGLTLAPFAQHAQSAGVDFPLTAACLTCHTRDDPARVPGASAQQGQVFPEHLLGREAFQHLRPLGCEACHGDSTRHLRIVTGVEPPGAEGGVGLARLGRLAPAEQRDVCARCHLQGDERFDLTTTPQAGHPLAGQIAVVVPDQASDDFRFVGQLERLSLSACFKSGRLTCTSCHRPHQGVRAQGGAAFDAACAACHARCSRPATLTVAQVTGAPARSRAGCVDCHVRRSAPFDLPHVRAADHFVRRRIPRPVEDLTHRAVANPQGALRVFDDGRLAQAWTTPEGQRWRGGVLAMALSSLGRTSEALTLFERFPRPGTSAARTPTNVEGLVPLQTSGLFHHLRALTLQAGGRTQEALLALDDALDVEPARAGARLARAELRLRTGDRRGLLADTQVLIQAFPRAEAPWNLRAALAVQARSAPLALAAFEASTRAWPSDAAAWHELGRWLRGAGRAQDARTAFGRAQLLAPSRPGLAADLASVASRAPATAVPTPRSRRPTP